MDFTTIKTNKMKNILLLLLTLITFSTFSQNPDYHRYGARTKFVQPDTLSTAQRTALNPKLGTLIYHKDTGVSQWEQWDGDSWEELGGDGAVSSVNYKIGAVVIDPDDLDDYATINKFVTQEEKDLIFTALQDAPSDGNEYVRKDGDWEVASGGSDDQTASEVPFTPYSTIAATNVQTAIQEVVDEIPTSLAAANITVSPAIGGNTDSYAVMDDHEDRIEDLENAPQTEVIQIAAGNLTSDITTGTAKAYFRMPYAATLTDVRVSLLVAGTTTGITVDINENGTSVLSTKLTTDATEKTSTTATTPAVISDSSLADDAEMTIDFDAVPTGGKAPIVTLYLIRL